MIARRLVHFIQRRERLSGCFEDDSFEAIVAELNQDPNLLNLLLEEYKRETWHKKRPESVGSVPCTSLKELGRVSRKSDEKMLILCGWFHEDGGLRGYCAYCGVEIDIHEMEIEHVVPRVRGGTESLDNLVPACPDCNDEKGELGTEEFLIKLGCNSEQVEKMMVEWNERFEIRASTQAVWAHRLSEAQLERLGLTQGSNDKGVT